MIACGAKSKIKNTEFEDYAKYLESNFSAEDNKSIDKVSNIINKHTLNNLDTVVNDIKNQCEDIEWLDINILKKALNELGEIEKIDFNVVGTEALKNTTVWDRISVKKEEESIKEKVDIREK